jgi:hypothetical protein
LVFLIHTEWRCTVNHTSDLKVYLFNARHIQRKLKLFNICCVWRTLNKYNFVVWYTKGDVSYKSIWFVSYLQMFWKTLSLENFSAANEIRWKSNTLHGAASVSSSSENPATDEDVPKFDVCVTVLLWYNSLNNQIFPVALRPNAGHGLLILEVSRSHATTHHSR